MADKEATVFILDLGASMARANAGRDESDLDWCMRYVWDKITDVVAANRKTLCVGIVGLRTDETNNKLQADDGYENISVLQDLGQMTTPSLRTLQESIRPSSSWSGDAISAIVVAVDMMETFTKKLKWIRKVVLITDGQGEMDADGIDDIAQKINDSAIQLTILGVDFDNPEYGFKEEEKSETKAASEAALRKLVDACDSAIFATMAEAIDELDLPRVKAIKPFKTYDGPLTLGDPETLPCAVNINVERFFATHLARPLAATTVVFKSDQATGTQSTHTLEGDASEGADFASVKQARAYKVNDPDAPGGKRDVEFEKLARGYEYGRTAVYISESEHNITKLESQKSFSILGFIPCNKYEPFLNMGETCATYARQGDAKSELALSSLVWALDELESYAVARIVVKDGKDPMLVLMAPHIEPGLECLYDVPLPFAEDVRSYQFPPLDRVLTVSGQTLTNHRLLPSDELNEAMNDYVDAMDLSTYGTEGGMGSAEYATIDETFNPSIHRINHAVRIRAVHPEKPLPQTPRVLLRYCAPPEDLIERVHSRIKALVEVAEVKKVPPKAKGRRARESVKPISGLDVDALLGDKKKGQVSRENAIPDFKQALVATTSTDEVEDVAKQMGAIVRGLVTDSFGDSRYAQAAECMGVMREELLRLEEPDVYNTFVRELKKALLSGALSGDRREFWYLVRSSRLGLIDKDQTEVSAVLPEEAEEVHTMAESIVFSVAPYHIISYGTLLGASVFHSFINGPVMYKSIDRPAFSAAQQNLFPIYFSLQTALPAVLALTFPGSTLAGVPNSVSGLLDVSSRWDSLVPIATMFVTGLVNLAVLLPATVKTMKERRGQCVLWSGDEVFQGVPETLEMLRSRGKRTVFVTNNSTKSRQEYAEKLLKLGIPSKVDDIFGSSYSAAVYISRILKLPEDKNKVFVIGEAGVEAELASEGVPFIGGSDVAFRRDVTSQDFQGIADGSLLDPRVAVVLCGLDFHVNYLKLAHALHYLQRGALFLATNLDSTFPTYNGLFIGAGSVLAPLANATGKTPLELGKPSQAMMDAIEGKFRLDRARTCMVGDRLDTDIKFGLQGKLGGTLHVQTGVNKKEDWQSGDAVAVPSFFADKLSDLLLTA
ncbi:hypothetical protein L249_6454 [Ophiocordyceps polyrhachis-furcata BCC 54312]|uniref:4-nitrophenylphosphatase n=1 Tax=Ophiocordyceps polyrhachis-furcata BCC 54312 TaxID=1330021 RepID=A0A367LJY2_9HYPO|nr:hypothetical protein L249_6454 [Ophiocordyceps polyrhachis-furcata BCC 54312]